jgi:ABC-type transport system substrate-binding protein
MTDGVSNAVGVHLHEGLVRLHPQTSELISGVAETWSVEDGGAAYVFNLRKGALFHASDWFGNGSREITAKDVAYSFETLAKNSEEQLFNATLGGRIVGAEDYRNGNEPDLRGVEVVDDYTVRVKLEQTDRSFLSILAMPALGIVPTGSADAEKPEVISAGPFMLVPGEPDLTLIRNPQYFTKDEFGNRYPYLDTLIFVPIEQNSDRLEAFFRDEIDVVSNLELDPIREILEQHVPDFSGKSPKYVLKRETDNASYDTYSIYSSNVKNLGSGFMGYRDFTRVQVEQ